MQRLPGREEHRHEEDAAPEHDGREEVSPCAPTWLLIVARKQRRRCPNGTTYRPAGQPSLIAVEGRSPDLLCARAGSGRRDMRRAMTNRPRMRVRRIRQRAGLEAADGALSSPSARSRPAHAARRTRHCFPEMVRSSRGCRRRLSGSRDGRPKGGSGWGWQRHFGGRQR
jgi:hypothetical protein